MTDEETQLARELAATALARSPEWMDAVPVLFTAGLQILMEQLGPERAAQVMRECCDGIAAGLLN